MKILQWTSYVRPFIQNKYDTYFCMLCDCIIRKCVDEHIRGTCHALAFDHHGFYILPLENDCYYCICCDLVIDNYHAVYFHTKKIEHELLMKNNAKKRLKSPIDWSSAKDFACPFIARVNSEEFYCAICHLMLTEATFWLHVNELKHVRALKRYNPQITPLENDYYHCLPCNFVIPRYVNIHDHLYGRKHRDTAIPPIDWAFSDDFDSPFIYRLKNNAFYCMICNQQLTTRNNLDIHEKGESHVSGLIRDVDNLTPIENGLYRCNTCHCIIPSYDRVHSHISGVRHSKSLSENFWKNRQRRKAIKWSSKKCFVEPFIFRENGDEFYCIICNYHAKSSNKLESHVRGKSHEISLERDRFSITPLDDDCYQCDVCNCVIPNHMYIHCHLNGSKHLQMLHFIQKKCDKQWKKSNEADNARDENGNEVKNETMRMIMKKCEEHLKRPNEVVDAREENRDEAKIETMRLIKKKSGEQLKKSNETNDAKEEKSDEEKIETMRLIEKKMDKESMKLNEASSAREKKSYKAKIETKRTLEKKSDKESKKLNEANNMWEEKSGKVKIETKRVVEKSSSSKSVDFRSSTDDNYMVDECTVTKSRSYRNTEEKCSHSILDRSSRYYSSIVKNKFDDCAKMSNRKSKIDNLIEFDDTQLNFQLGLRCSRGPDNNMTNFHGNEIESRKYSDYCDCLFCHSILKIFKIENFQCNGWMSPKQIEISMKTDLDEDEIFSLINKDIRTFLEQLRIKERNNVGKNPQGSIDEMRNSFFKQFSSGGSATSRLKYLLSSLIYFIENETDENVNAKIGNSLVISEMQCTSKMENPFIDDSNTAIEWSNKISLDQGPNEATDSGFEDSFPLISTSTTLNENSGKQGSNELFTETIVKLLNYDRDILIVRIRKMEFSMQLNFVIDSEDDYCMICRKIVSNELDQYIEHLSDSQHGEYLDKMAHEHAHCSTVPERFSRLYLAYEYIEALSKESTMCLVCGIEIRRINRLLQKHIDEKSHREAWEKMRTRGRDKVIAVKSQIKYDWYKVQKYQCLLCLKNFKLELDFVEHLESAEHTSIMEKKRTNEDAVLIYDFCALCALLWCAFPTTRTNHCDSQTHKWIAKNGTSVINELPELAKNLLETLKNVRYLKGNVVNSNDLDVIAASCRTSIVRAHEKGTGHYSDLSAVNEAPIADIKLIKLFNKIFPPCEKIISFLIRWLILCDLSGPKRISTHALYWYFIFYLQMLSIIPSVATLNSMKKFWHEIADNEEFSENRVARQSTSNCSFKQHLVGFFAFYANFDYRNAVACPLLGKEVKKLVFAKPENLPEEMKSYDFYTSNSVYAEPFRIDSPMCLQDPFDLQQNLTQTVSKADLIRFRKYCSKSMDVFCS